MKAGELLLPVGLVALFLTLFFKDVDSKKYESTATSSLVVDQWADRFCWAVREDGAFCEVTREEYARLLAARKNPVLEAPSRETTCRWSILPASK